LKWKIVIKKMISAFNVNRQNNKIDGKIVVALERIAEAFRVLLWNESKENSLSPIQIQILIFIFFHANDKCTVSYLAKEFNLSKPTISESIKLMEQKGFIKKIADAADCRSYSIALTAAGKLTAEKSSNFAFAIEKPLGSLTGEKKEIILSALLDLIYDLNQKGIITVQRMCFTCSNYQKKNGKHFCNLLQSVLSANELRVDCAEHEPVL